MKKTKENVRADIIRAERVKGAVAWGFSGFLITKNG